MVTACTTYKAPHNKSLLQSPYDTRDYKSITLGNQLEVLLISDPETDQAAAAMDVRVGQFQDPSDRQGLAHFLEHMLFLGTEKYPNSDEYGRYLSTHGGYSNAYTSHEDTNYFFTVNKDHLDGALDRFSQFFIAPTFDPQFVKREINAVNSEHQKNIKADGRRGYQILRETSNPAHPFHKFGTGNLETLQDNPDDHSLLRNQLIRFYQEHYSANTMKLVILGKESLPELELKAKQYFGAIKNRNLSIQTDSKVPIISAPLPRLISITPIKTTRSLQLMFPLPPQQQYYEFKPVDVLSQLIGDEGQGSILAHFKEKGWATSLSAGSGLGGRTFNFFNIRIGLTKEGVKHINEINRVVFQYIEKIKQADNLESYFDEAKKIAQIDFQFREKESPYGYVSDLAARSHDVKAAHILASRWLYKEFRPDLIENILKRLIPENLQMVLTAPNLVTDKLERWYQAPYGIETISQGDVESWKKGTSDPGLQLPKANPFIPETITFQPQEALGEYPVLIKDNPGSKIWFKQAQKFKVPKGNVKVLLSTPEAYATVEQAAMTRLYTMLLKDSLNEFSYPASVAGLHYSISNSVRGLEINLGGYPENLPLLFERILRASKNLQVDETKFKIFKNQIKERRFNQNLGQAFHRATYEMYYLLSETLWHTDDYLRIIEQIDIEKLRAFIPKLIAHTHIEVLAHGNFSSQEIQRLSSLLEDNFQNPTLQPLQPIEERTLNLPPASAYQYQFGVEDVNSAVQLYYQLGPQTAQQTVLVDLLQQILEKPFYHQLRTIEQLGYLVWSGQRVNNKIDGMFFMIQSSDRAPDYLQARIKLFLSNFRKTLSELPPQEFEKFRASAIAKREEKPKNLAEATQYFWDVIATQKYDFQYREKEIAVLKRVELKEIVALYDNMLLQSETVKEISVQAVGKNHKVSTLEANLITSPSKFKGTLTFYDNPTGSVPLLKSN